MSIVGESTWIGASGKKYTFTDHSLDTVFDENIKGNYIFAKPSNIPNRLTAVYIGEGELKDRIEFRINEMEVLSKGCDRVCVMVNANERYRKEIESDLLASNTAAYAPTGCNIKKGG